MLLILTFEVAELAVKLVQIILEFLECTRDKPYQEYFIDGVIGT